MDNSKEYVEVDSDLEDLIPNFINNRKKDIADLSVMVKNQDFIKIAQMAHRIKGSSAGYGFHRLSKIAAEMETAAKNASFTPIPTLQQQMEEYFNRVEVKFVQI